MSRPGSVDTERSPAAVLTAQYAAARSRRLADVRYALSLTLDGSAPAYVGEVSVAFVLRDARLRLTLDFTGGQVRRLAINGTAVEPDYNGYFLVLPPALLRDGPNTVQVDFDHAYGADGAGLHRLIDPEDSAAYLYSHFEPYDANRLFPCFDQPDLKATFELCVRAPADWTVITATREFDIDDEGETRVWRFPRTARFSTYLLGLHAGPFAQWQSAAGDIPLRLFARQTMADHIDADHWFDLARKGFAFFQDYFALPYPYGKYDSIVVPDFNIGAMENVAAVTFSEGYLKRGTPSHRDRLRLADVVMHEMSHMWFGNLVTMPWWDGLWLKESFATYMAQLATTRAAGLPEAVHGFCVESKERARRADRQVTTHPVDVPVPDTRDAFAQFDAITYNKGCAALIQLAHYVGEDAFRHGVRRYLATHAGGTATLVDFVQALAGCTEAPLDGWVDEWLGTAGINTLMPRVQVADGVIASFAIDQAAPADWPTLRRHRVQVGLCRRTADGAVGLEWVTPVTVAGSAVTVNTLVGKPAPDLVCLNVGDWGYVALEPDPVTLANLPALIGDLSDPLLRSVFFQALWDRTRNAAMSLSELLAIATELLAVDPNEWVCRQVYAASAESLSILARSAATDEALDRYTRGIEALTWDRLEAAPRDSDMGRFWLDCFIDVASSSAGMARLAALLEHTAGAPVTPDPDRRWAIIVALSSAGFDAAAGLVAEEKRRDPSDRGAKMALAADAARPEPDVKADWLHRLERPGHGFGLSRQRRVIAHLFPPRQAALHRRFAHRILAPLGEFSVRGDAAFLRAWVQMLPMLPDEANVRALAEVAANAAALHPVLDRALREAHHELVQQQAMIRLLDSQRASSGG